MCKYQVVEGKLKREAEVYVAVCCRFRCRSKMSSAAESAGSGDGTKQWLSNTSLITSTSSVMVPATFMLDQTSIEVIVNSSLDYCANTQ